MDISQALEIVKANRVGTLATLRGDGTPHLSIVMGAVVDGDVWFSLTGDRVKTRNVRNDPRISYLAGTGPWACVEGEGRFIEGLDALRRYYRAASGEHPDWEDYDRAMIADERVVLALTPAKASGFSP